LLNRLLYEVNLVDPKQAYNVMREACGILNTDLSSEICSAELATDIHKRTYELLGTRDPYVDIKALAMQVGLQLEDKAKTIINQSEDKLLAAILCSIVGNVLDFGIAGGMNTPEELIASFDQIYEEGLGYDDTEKIKKYVKKDAKIVLLTDNCGEIVFDRLLCHELKRSDVKIILVVKGEPILSDATEKEAQDIKMIDVVDKIINTGEYAVGLAVKNMPSELKDHLNTADLIISKGMGNFEALSETNLKPVLYLLRTKCAPVAAALRLPKNINVAKLIE
jgi:uncharacterized protein with ATP-grasp and redox domains